MLYPSMNTTFRYLTLLKAVSSLEKNIIMLLYIYFDISKSGFFFCYFVGKQVLRFWGCGILTNKKADSLDVAYLTGGTVG